MQRDNGVLHNSESVREHSADTNKELLLAAGFKKQKHSSPARADNNTRALTGDSTISMVTDRHESEDVTLVSSRVMKAKVSAPDADGRDPAGIFLLDGYQKRTSSSASGRRGYEHAHSHVMKSLRLQSRQMWTQG